MPRLTPEQLAERHQKRMKRTGLDYLHYEPQPGDVYATGDCVTRAMTWHFPELSYKEIAKELQDRTDQRFGKGRNVLRSGVCLAVIQQFMRQRGWIWKESKGPWEQKTKNYGGHFSCTTKQRKRLLFKAENLPRTCLAITSSHAVAVEDHIVVDAYDSRGDKSAYLEGYFIKG